MIIFHIYYYENATGNKKRIELALRRSFKSFTGLKKTTTITLTNDLMAYNIEKRSNYLQYTANQKWLFREKGQLYLQNEDAKEIARPTWPENICKNQPKLMIKYLNMQTSLCPRCKLVGHIARCSQTHLQSTHQIHIDSPYILASKVLHLTKTQLHKNNEIKLTRKALLNYAEKLIQPNMLKLKTFLNAHNQMKQS